MTKGDIFGFLAIGAMLFAYAYFTSQKSTEKSLKSVEKLINAITRWINRQ